MSSQHNKGQAFESFEKKHHALRMNLKMHKYLFLGCLALSMIFISWYLTNQSSPYELHLLKSKALIIASSLAPSFINPQVTILDPNSSQLYWYSLTALNTDYGIKQAIDQAFSSWLYSHYYLLSAFLLWPLSLILLRYSANKDRSEKHLRGAKELLSEKQIIKATKKGDLPFGKAKLPIENEVTHTVIIGAAGKGKTVFMSALLERLIERGEQLICHDFKGDYLEKYYRPEVDLILNPLDKRGLKWNIFSLIPKNNPMAASIAATQICSVLIPSPRGSGDPFWSNASRQVLKAIILALYETGRTTNEFLWKTICFDAEKLIDFLTSTKAGLEGAANLSSKGSSNQTLGILSTINTNTSFLQYMPSGDFDLDDWISQGKGSMYLLNNPAVQEVLKPVLTLFLDVAAKKILAKPDSQNHKMFFILDELGQLGKTDTIKDLVTLGRSKGAAMFMAFQDMGQIDKIYGHEDRKSILNSASNAALFGLNDPDTAKFCADKIGKHEVMETNESNSMGPDDYKDGKTFSHHRKELYLVRPEDLMGLNPLNVYITMDKVGTAKIKLQVTNRESINPPFQMIATEVKAFTPPKPIPAYEKVTEEKIQDEPREEQDKSNQDETDLNKLLFQD